MKQSQRNGKDRTYRRKLKLRAVEMLGGRCACGFSDPRALCVYHRVPVRRGRNGLPRKARSSTMSHLDVVRGDAKSLKLKLMCWNCCAIEASKDWQANINVKPDAGAAANGARPKDGAA
jgi:hypothetical protein